MPFELSDFISNTLSVLMPILGTIIAGLVLYAKQDYDRVQNIRRAFLAELNAVVLPTYIKLDDGTRIPEQFNSKLVPTSVYDSNTPEIGKLTAQEVHSIVDFYSYARNPNHLKEVMMDLEMFLEDPKWNLTHLEEKKETAIENVESGIDTSFWRFIWEKVR